jgi:hypothetical protein
MNPLLTLATTTLLLTGTLHPAQADDDIDRLLRNGQVPADMTNRHGYSDFTTPLGRYLDLLAAGAFAEARPLQPHACADWRATRENSAFTGKFWIWNTEFSLDKLCLQP